jgi:hypothetical protein
LKECILIFGWSRPERKCLSETTFRIPTKHWDRICYLTAVFELVAWWMAENRALERAQKALRLRHIIPFDNEEPFAAIIRCTADPAKVDKRTRSKWSRALRYALAYKSHLEPLDRFMKRKGGINRCAERCSAQRDEV